MSVLVTGGAGFIGSHLLDRLAAQGREAVCLDNFDDYYSPDVKRRNIAGALATGRAQLVEGDIRNRGLCAELCRTHGVDCIVHLAARAGVRPSIENPLLYEDVNCGGTLALLECARRSGVRKFVFGSSSSVYGINAKVPFSEEDPIALTISPYAASKRSCELYAHAYHHLYGLPVVCLRFFTVYGPRQRPDLAIHKFTRLIEKGEPVPVFGDGTARRDYTYCSDIVDGIVAAMDAQLDFEIINLGCGAPVALSDLIALIEESLGKEARIKRLPDQPGDVPVTYADIGKARQLLGYEPSYPVGKGIRDFVEWFRENC